jgi:hypothetical protein
MKIMIIYETMPERTDVYLHEHLLELMDSGDAELMWPSDTYGCNIPLIGVSEVCITGHCTVNTGTEPAKPAGGRYGTGA